MLARLDGLIVVARWMPEFVAKDLDEDPLPGAFSSSVFAFLASDGWMLAASGIASSLASSSWIGSCGSAIGSSRLTGGRP